jgi:hypothetical protein
VAVSEENVEVIRKPLRVRERSKRTLDQRLAIRFPRLSTALARPILRLPPTSRVRQAVLWRVTQLGIEAFNRRDVDAAVSPGAADFEYYPPREFVEAGFFEPCYRGPAGFREYVSTWSDVFGPNVRVDPVELIDAGDRMVMLADLAVRTQTGGVPFTGKIATVSVLENGRATRVEAYSHHAEALECVGLAEQRVRLTGRVRTAGSRRRTRRSPSRR